MMYACSKFVNWLPTSESRYSADLLKEEVTPKWYDFGLVVGVPKEEMDHYSVTQCSSDQCLIEVLDYWLRHHPSQLTWKEVAHSLKEIKLHQLAEKVPTNGDSVNR